MRRNSSRKPKDKKGNKGGKTPKGTAPSTRQPKSSRQSPAETIAPANLMRLIHPKANYVNFGASKFSNSEVFISNATMPLDFNRNSYEFATGVIAPALDANIDRANADKYDATQVTDLAKYITNWAQILYTIISKRNLAVYGPLLTKSDSSGQGSPFTYGTIHKWETTLLGLVDSTFPVPFLSVFLARAATQSLQIVGSIRDSGQRGTYIVPSASLSGDTDLDTLFSNVGTYSSGLTGSVRLGHLVRPLQQEDLYPTLPISMESDLGQLISSYYPVEIDVAGTQTWFGDAFDATTGIYYNQRYGISELINLAPFLFSPNSRTNSLILNSTTAIANDRNTLGWADYNDTSISRMTNGSSEWTGMFRHFAANAPAPFQWLRGVEGYGSVVPGLSASAWDNGGLAYLAGVIAQKRDKPLYVSAPMYPDEFSIRLSNRGAAGLGSTYGWTTQYGQQHYEAAASGPRPQESVGQSQGGGEYT